MGTYYCCSGCGNQEVGDTIYQCRKCTKIYCSSCGTWDKTKCPRCGDQTILFAPTIGSIESPSSEEESEEEEKKKSSSDDDDDDDDDDFDKEYLREMIRYIQLPEEKQDPESLEHYAWFIRHHGGADLVLSKFGHLPIAKYLKEPSSFKAPSLSASASSSSDADKSSSGNDSAEEVRAKNLLLLLFAFVSIVCFAVYKGFIEKPSTPLTDNKEVTAEIAPNEVTPQQEAANEAIMPNETEVPTDNKDLSVGGFVNNSAPAESISETTPLVAPTFITTKGVVTWIDYAYVYLEEGERPVYGTSIFVKLANGGIAHAIFAAPNPTAIGAPDYATPFNRGDRVILFLRRDRSDGTVKTTKHPFLEATGDQVPGSKIHIQLDNGNEAFVFLDFDANLNLGERVRVISHEGM